jgi:3-oxoacyl-[acyl-carrier-protein] synthase III
MGRKGKIKESALPKSTQYHLKQAERLVGKTVKEIVVDLSDPTIDPIIGILFGDGTLAFVLRDEEGNGPGALEILLDPKESDG